MASPPQRVFVGSSGLRLTWHFSISSQGLTAASPVLTISDGIHCGDYIAHLMDIKMGQQWNSENCSTNTRVSALGGGNGVSAEGVWCHIPPPKGAFRCVFRGPSDRASQRTVKGGTT